MTKSQFVDEKLIISSDEIGSSSKLSSKYFWLNFVYDILDQVFFQTSYKFDLKPFIKVKVFRFKILHSEFCV